MRVPSPPLVALVLLFAATAVGAGDSAPPTERERAAAAAFAFAALSAPVVTAPAPAPDRVTAARAAFAFAAAAREESECGCHATGSCGCGSGGCGCCGDLPGYAEQTRLAKANRLVLVAYFGSRRGACFDGAVSAADPAGPARIIVGYPDADRVMRMSEELPADSLRGRIEVAVRVAAGKRDAATRPMPMPATAPPTEPAKATAPVFDSATPVGPAGPTCRNCR